MRCELATDDQLWTIMKHDKEVPLSLLEGIFQEAVDRGMIRKAVIHVIKCKGITPENNNKFGVTYDDFIQIGYEGALKAMKIFEPGRGKFTDVMYYQISHALGEFFVFNRAQKRSGNVISYQKFLTSEQEDTIEVYLMDRKTNVEKTVITKMLLEEKLNELNEKQRELFQLCFVGYTMLEMAELTNSKKSTVQWRLQKALEKMSGHKINLIELGYQRIKKQGA